MNALFSVKDKIIIITGALGLLGRAFVEFFSKEGAIVVAIDKEKEATEHFAKTISAKTGYSVLGIGMDITNEAEIDQLVDLLNLKYQRIDVVINNAATKGASVSDFFEPFETFAYKTWKEVMAVNLDALYLLSQKLGTFMVNNSIRGCFIQVASIYGVVAPDQRLYEGSEYLGHQISSPAVYSASKSGVIGLTKYLAAYWGKHGIRVNALVPGGVYSGQNGVFSEKYSAKVPLGRMANIEDFFGPLLFLSSEASAYMTGHQLMVDGGFSVW